VINASHLNIVAGGQAKNASRRCVPDGKSALMLAATGLRNVTDSKWDTRRYLDMNR
jgi:hypothetical protein